MCIDTEYPREREETASEEDEETDISYIPCQFVRVHGEGERHGDGVHGREVFRQTPCTYQCRRVQGQETLQVSERR